MSSNEWTLPEPGDWGMNAGGEYPIYTAEQMREAYAAGQRAAVPEGKLLAEIERLRKDILNIYESIPSLPVTPDNIDAATDVLAKFCVDFADIIDPPIVESLSRASQPPAAAPTDAAQERDTASVHRSRARSRERSP